MRRVWAERAARRWRVRGVGMLRAWKIVSAITPRVLIASKSSCGEIRCEALRTTCALTRRGVRTGGHEKLHPVGSKYSRTAHAERRSKSTRAERTGGRACGRHAIHFRPSRVTHAVLPEEVEVGDEDVVVALAGVVLAEGLDVRDLVGVLGEDDALAHARDDRVPATPSAGGMGVRRDTHAHTQRRLCVRVEPSRA
jgi:hypothetical protein